MLNAYFAQKVVTESGSGKKKTKELSFQPITNAIIGYKVYIVVETSNLSCGDITVEIIGNKDTRPKTVNPPADTTEEKGMRDDIFQPGFISAQPAPFLEENKAATLLSGGTEQSKFTAKVGNYQSKSEYKNAANFKDIAIIEVELKAKDDQITKGWIKEIRESVDKKAYVHLSVTSTGGNATLYNCEDDVLTSPNSEKGLFYNKKATWFEIYACLCGKKLIAMDLQLLGITKSNAEKFLGDINLTIGNYSINTCLRLAHFLAQARHESVDFKNLKEIWGPTKQQLGYEGRSDLGNIQPGDGKKFMGRGLIQLTGRTNYLAYGLYKGKNYTTGSNNEKLEQTDLAVDTAGWYWSKKLGVDLNIYADKDDLIYCTYRINPAYKGYDDRKKKILDALHAIKNCRDVDLSTKGTYAFDTSNAYKNSDAVYKWARMLYNEGKKAAAGPYYKRYLIMQGEEIDTETTSATSNKVKVKHDPTTQERIGVAKKRMIA